MTHDLEALPSQRDGPGTIGVVSAKLYPASSVFEEPELKRMRGVFDAVCQALNITTDSPDARAAALAVIHHASVGYTDAQALKEAVINKLRPNVQAAPA